MKEQLNAILEKFVITEDDYSNFKREVIEDYVTAVLSREVSIIARKEVLTGKAKFGITGDGKELAQIAMAKAFQKGDWKAGYYRDQTFMFSKSLASVKDYFSQLYSDCDNDPFSSGRQMNNHFASPIIDKDGNWLEIKNSYNISADISCTGGQVARAIGHAYASKIFRDLNDPAFEHLTDNGNEVCFLTIGDASTSEGAFWEMMNAAGVLDIPLIAAVWDDGYGISVPIDKQTTKSSISKAMEGLLIDENGKGIHIFVAKAWDYQELCSVFKKASKLARRDHKAVLIHVQECTQPQGHSSSGSHERYKSKERLAWEEEFDCVDKMRDWLLQTAILTQDQLDEIHNTTRQYVKEEVKTAWNNYFMPVKIKLGEFNKIFSACVENYSDKIDFKDYTQEIKGLVNPSVSEFFAIGKKVSFELRALGLKDENLNRFLSEQSIKADINYNSKLHSDTQAAALNQVPVKPVYSESSKTLNGYQIINKFFDTAFAKRNNLIAFGEDLGKIGDVNQGFVGLQEKYGETRITDTGIREWTIVGQALGSSMRGLRPIVEIQYLDYLVYAFSPLSDDLATVRWRTNGLQHAPMIVRTRGHRLEGVWHSGSPMGVILSGMRGIYLCVPRNFVQAAGMYNTLLDSDDPGIVIECLNGYRLKEVLPDNIADIKIPLGSPEILKTGRDITLVTYGSCVRIAQKALLLADKMGISVELIDVQTLMPFDVEHTIVESLKKTNKIIFLDEDLPGAATAFMMREVMETQKGFKYMDAPPVCISAKDHRTPFGSDGDYFTKPNPEQVFEEIYKLMNLINPSKFP